MVTQPILNSLIFTTLQNWHFLTALQIGRKFQWLPDGLCYHSEATDITKKGNFSGFLCNILVPEEATEIDYILQEVTDFAYLELLISVASELNWGSLSSKRKDIVRVYFFLVTQQIYLLILFSACGRVG